MFTGLVQTLGQVSAVEARGPDRRFVIAAPGLPLAEITLGESIAVNGVCLTVVEKLTDGFAADVSAESLRCTNLGNLEAGGRLNLERCLTLQSLIGGHLVSGHVDAVGVLLRAEPVGECMVMNFALPADLLRYIAVKGSICVDGTSLTVNRVDPSGFEVNLIPHTLTHTIAGGYRPGRVVNIEVDIIARYAERLLALSPSAHRA